MSLDDLINMTIVADTTSPTRPGFATIAILAGLVPATFPANVPQEYRSLTEMTDASFTTTMPAYKLATRIFSQKTRVSKIKVWKRSLPAVQSTELKVTSAIEGEVYTITVNDTAISYTVLAAATTTTVATAIELLIDAVAGVDCTSATDTITVTKAAASPAGTLVQFSDWSANFHLTDATPDPGIATDLAALQTADSDWYGLALDSNSKAEIAAAATWVEANKKLFPTASSDSDCVDSGVSTDAMSVNEAAGNVRTAVIYNGNDTMGYSGAGWMGGRFPFQPGSYTWAYKQIAGAAPDALTGGQMTAIENKSGNTYTTMAGVPITLFGLTGGGEYIDVTQFIDWLRSEIQIRVFTRLATLPKIPYTDLGVDLVISEVLGALKAGVKAGGLDPGNDDDIPAPAASAPKVSEISTTDRAGRHLPDVKFSGRLAGAIHTMDINGTLSV